MKAQHVQNGTIYRTTEEVQRAGQAMQAELEEIAGRYGIHGMVFFALNMVDAGQASPNLSVAALIAGCLSCTAFALARAAHRDEHVADLLNNTMLWVTHMAAHPEVAGDEGMPRLAFPDPPEGSKPN